MRDAPPPLVHQVLGHQVAALVVVHHHGAYLAAGENAVEKHQRHFSLLHLVEVLEVVRGTRERHQNAVDLRIHQRLHVLGFVRVVFVGLAQHHVVSGLVGHFLDSFHHQGKKVAVDVGHDDAQRVATPLAQGCRQVVGLVVELFGQLPHALAGGLADAGMVAQRPRNGGNGEVQLLGNVRDGSRFGGQGSKVKQVQVLKSTGNAGCSLTGLRAFYHAGPCSSAATKGPCVP